MARDRSSGILLHPTSLPGAWGIGDLGPAAGAFLDWLEQAGQTIWQILPLGPVGLGNSPYSSTSAFATSTLLISPELLERDGLLPSSALDPAPYFSPGRVDYPVVSEWKEALLRIAWQHANQTGDHRDLVQEARELATSPDYAAWLPDWTLYSALKRRFESQTWQSWPRAYRDREETTLDVARRELEEELHFQSFCQLLCARQWSRVRSAARDRGIRILGDVPIYVALDSADVWAHQELFDLDGDGWPNAVAGVPADAFSESGQTWGNPLYRWEASAATRFAWWIERLRSGLRVADLLRIDHFRGFAACWSIPAGRPAIDGEWVPGPGLELFQAARAALGELPLVAEDLGVITPDVRQLRLDAGLPGTRVLQFAFDDPASEHLPHNLDPDIYLYTGTHDNPPTITWFESLDGETRARVLDYVGGDGGPIHWSLLRVAQTSVARAAIFPLQDVLGLADGSRMNRPADPSGSWEWRLDELPGSEEAERLARLTRLTGRLPAAATTEQE